MKHDSGQLRHQVVHETLTEAPDSYGQFIQTWVTDTSVPNGIYACYVQTLSGREAENARQIRSDIDTIIVMRYLPGLTTRDRFRFGGWMLNVVAVIDEENRNRWAQIFCASANTGNQWNG